MELISYNSYILFYIYSEIIKATAVYMVTPPVVFPDCCTYCTVYVERLDPERSKED
jgi:hypothetical protein